MLLSFSYVRTSPAVEASYKVTKEICMLVIIVSLALVKDTLPHSRAGEETGLRETIRRFCGAADSLSSVCTT
jgi:hypothetical protein